jgi:hypothetical protein
MVILIIVANSLSHGILLLNFFLIDYLNRGIPNAAGFANLSSHTPEQGVYALDQFIRSVYHSSIDKDIGACDFESLSEFVCGREDPWRSAPWFDKIQAPIRAGRFSYLIFPPF